MTREFLDILNNKCALLLPCRATDTASELDACTCRCTLERTEYQFVTVYNIETNPEIFLWKYHFHYCSAIRQYTDRMVSIIREYFYLRDQFCVS